MVFTLPPQGLHAFLEWTPYLYEGPYTVQQSSRRLAVIFIVLEDLFFHRSGRKNPAADLPKRSPRALHHRAARKSPIGTVGRQANNALGAFVSGLTGVGLAVGFEQLAEKTGRFIRDSVEYFATIEEGARSASSNRSTSPTPNTLAPWLCATTVPLFAFSCVSLDAQQPPWEVERKQ
jgi:hypothetical protein